MKIFIVGAGEVGLHIASSLVREGHDLVIIERDQKKVTNLQSTLDILAVAGDGCDPSLLRDHGVADADLFFAVSNDDAVNLLSALTARCYGAARAVVRVGSPHLGKNPLLKKDDQIVPLHPERLVADEIHALTSVPGVGKARYFSNRRLVLIQARPSIKAAIYGRPLKQLAGPSSWILVGIHRASGTVIPRGDTTLRPGDLVYAVGPTETLPEFLESIDVESTPTRRVVVVGAGQVGTSLARRLVHDKVEVVVIQRGEKRALALAAAVPEALVLRGDATDPEMLREAGVDGADYFVAATQQDETNLLSSLLAREAGARSTVALYHRPEFLNLMHAVRIDVPLSPRMMVAGEILRMVHRREIVSMDLVEGGDAEVVEFEVPAKARVLKKDLMHLHFPRASIVGAVLRGGEIYVPRGSFRFQEGDRALVFTLSEALGDLERMFPRAMNLRGVLFLLGRLLLALTVALLVPAAVSYYQGTVDTARAFLISATIAGMGGSALQHIFRHSAERGFSRREAFVLVASAWITASAVGALPYVFIKGSGFMVDALFESASGFTTTGASILSDIEAETPGLLLWRSLTQWLGGMGIIVLGIAILPKLAVGGMDLLGAEAPGPTTEKLTPRIAQTAKALWVLYVIYTVVETLALKLAGMTLFDATNHALTTMATGGFSTNNASIAGFDNPLIEVIITVFMVLAGVNFALHFKLLRGRPGPLLRDSEFRFYVGLMALATVLVAGDLLLSRHGEGFLEALRSGAFQVATMTTTTGFATADFDTWPHFSRALLFLLMFVGGCAGSTGGSVKVVRIMIVAKKLVVDLKRLVRPHAVLPVTVGKRAIPEDVVTSVTTFFILFLTLFSFGGLLLSAMGLDLISAFSASAACIGNIGPGFGLVGPTQNFGFMPVPGKIVLVLLMIIGRLELYTMLVLFFLRPRS